MSSSDIKAGGAYVEIGAKSDAFEKAMNAVEAKFKASMASAHQFGEGLASIGTKIAAFGGAMLAPLAASVHAFADFGAEIEKVHAKTGMDTDFIQTLKSMADESGVAFNAVSKGVVTMERNISSSNKRAVDAINSIGLSFDDIKNLKPEDQYDAMTKALSGVSDEGTRAAAAQAIFGGAGLQMLPMLERGSEALQAAAYNARQLNSAISPEAATRALELQQSFKHLEEAGGGLSHQIGDVLTPIVKPLVDRLIDITSAASRWVEQNPELVQSFAKGAANVALLGTALATTGAAIMAITSPAIVATVAVAGVALAVLAVTDQLGATNTGIGDLADSFRVFGHGIGTELSMTGTLFAITWDGIITGAKLVWNGLTTGFTSVWAAIKMGMAGFNSFVFGMLDGIILKTVSALNAVIGAYNKVASTVGGKSVALLQTPGELAEKTKSDKDYADAKKEYENATYAGNTYADKEQAGLASRTQKRLEDANYRLSKDYDPSGATKVDTHRAENAIEKINNGMSSLLDDIIAKLTGTIPKVNLAAPGEKNDGGGGTDISQQGPKYSAVGTFNAYAGAGIAGTGIFHEQLNELKSHSHKLDAIRDGINNSGGSFGLAGN